MTWRGQILLTLLCALALAAIAHLSTVLAIPWLGEQDALTRLRRTTNAERTQVIPIVGQDWPPTPDPSVVLAACVYNLDDGPARISARTGGLFESLSFHARGGVLFYAVTERAAVRGALDLVVMTESQRDAAIDEDGDEPSTDVRIVAPARDGFVIVRILVGLPSQREEAEGLARAVVCTTDAAIPN